MEDIINLFGEIKRNIEDYQIFKEKKIVGDFLLKKYYKIFGKYIKGQVTNYNHIAPYFNRTYFWKNLLKNIIFFNEYFELVEDGIVDVGCGAAPASIAILSLTRVKGKKESSLYLIDKSTRQLEIAKDLLKIISPQLEIYQEKKFCIREHKYDKLVVFSYFFCEQGKDFLEMLYKNRKNFSKGFVVIDYKSNVIKIKDYFDKNNDNNVECVFLSQIIPENMLNNVYAEEVKVYGCIYRA